MCCVKHPKYSAHRDSPIPPADHGFHPRPRPRDDAKIRQMLSRYFEGEGFQVTTADDGIAMRKRLLRVQSAQGIGSGKADVSKANASESA